MHGITTGKIGEGNLNAYKVHRSIKKEPGVFAGVYDGAWEMFVPIGIWKDYNERGLIQYLGFSGKKAQRQGRPQTMRVAAVNNMIIKKIADNIDQIKQYASRWKKIREILAVYLRTLNFPDEHTASYYTQGYNIPEYIVKQAEFIFKKNNIPYKKVADFRV
jgi:hypothetical protein